MPGEEQSFNEGYCQRVQELRQALGWTQEQMATALNVPLDRYKKYEIRSPLPCNVAEHRRALTALILPPS